MTESIFTPAQDSNTPNGIERRRDPRAQVLKAAKMVYGNFLETAINCTLVDASESGVRVETGVMIQVPEKVQLQVPGQGSRWARRRWAIGNQIGLEFINSRPLGFALN